MQFEINHQIGTNYSIVTFKTFGHGSIGNVFKRLGGIEEDWYVWIFPNYITSEVLKEVIRNTCFVCGGLMKDSIAFQNQDVIEIPNGLSMTSHVFKGEAQQIKVRKCMTCGHSHT